MLDAITPIILTYNEAPNIGRNLKRLSWARDIVVVDSFSDDDTAAIDGQFPTARLFQRKFDSHATQWNFALQETGIATEWVLALDADHLLSDELIAELERMSPPDDLAGYEARYVYCIGSHLLRGAAYPPVTALYRRNRAIYRQDGHTQRVVVEGNIGTLQATINHDDHKPMNHWLASQNRYMALEAHKLRNLAPGELGMADRVRRLRVVAPLAMPIYCLFVKGAILDGKPGIYYALQRMLAELMLSLYLLHDDIFDAPRRQA
jgi:glycosyltransferase involved in cell wall biosynthesis